MPIPPPPPMPPAPQPSSSVRIETVESEGVAVEQDSSIRSDVFLSCMYIINTITHLTIGALATVAFLFANQFENASLKQHIYLCVTGYIILMSQAILSISPFNGWTQNIKYRKRKTVHWVTQIIGSTLAITGSVIRITNVENNFETTHGILGLIALIFTFLSLAGGVVNLMTSRAGLKTSLFKIFHASIGVLTITVAFLCLMYAFRDTFFRAVMGDINATMMMVLSIVGLVGTVTSACMHIMSKMFA